MDTAQIHTIHSILNFCFNFILHKIQFANTKIFGEIFGYLFFLENFFEQIMSTVLKFHKLSAKAVTPARGSEYAAGLDLFSAESKVIPKEPFFNKIGTLV